MAINIGKSIKVALAQGGFNNNWLAEKLGVSKQFTSRLSNTDTTTLVNVVKLAAIFDMKVSEFIGRGED